jgi:hypothetical protein
VLSELSEPMTISNQLAANNRLSYELARLGLVELVVDAMRCTGLESTSLWPPPARRGERAPTGDTHPEASVTISAAPPSCTLLLLAFSGDK